MISILIIALLSVIAQLILPWWSVAIVAFGVAYFRSETAGQSFWAGAIGIGLVWQIYVLVIHIRNAGVLTGRISQLFFKADMPILLLEVSVLIGALIGGLAAYSGYLCRRAVSSQVV